MTNDYDEREKARLRSMISDKEQTIINLKVMIKNLNDKIDNITSLVEKLSSITRR